MKKTQDCPSWGPVRDPRPAPPLRGWPGWMTGSELAQFAARRVTVHASPPGRGRLAASRISTVRLERGQRREPRREFHVMATFSERGPSQRDSELYPVCSRCMWHPEAVAKCRVVVWVVACVT